MGPVQMPNQSVGFPDGNPAPAVVVDFRQTYTITPSSGTVRYALLNSPFGSLAVHTGAVVAQRPKFLTSTDLTYTWTSAASITYTGNAGFVVQPFQEVATAGSAPSANPFGPYSCTKYRGLVVVADSYFTGATMANGGVAKVYKMSANSTSETQVNYNTVACQKVEYQDLMTGIGSAAGSLTSPARSTLNLRAVNPKPEYKSCFENTSTINVCPAFLNSAGSVLTDGLWTGFDTDCPVTVVEYTGLDATASITVELRCCVEMVVQPGSLPGIARPSPVADMNIWQRVANFARSVPTARVIAAGATGYLNGGPLAALTAATQAMSFGS